MDTEEHEDYDPRARAAILQGIEDQLRSPETPEVKAELDRLLSGGVKTEDAKEMMALVLGIHIAHMVRQKQPFDYPAYLDELAGLPEIDLDKEI